MAYKSTTTTLIAQLNAALGIEEGSAGSYTFADYDGTGAFKPRVYQFLAGGGVSYARELNAVSPHNRCNIIRQAIRRVLINKEKV